MSPSFVNCFLYEVGSSVSTTSLNQFGLNFKLHLLYSGLIISFTFRHQFFTANTKINEKYNGYLLESTARQLETAARLFFVTCAAGQPRSLERILLLN